MLAVMLPASITERRVFARVTLDKIIENRGGGGGRGREGGSERARMGARLNYASRIHEWIHD